jgi:rare lipoprotein A (peptidoglycan hydrolase)
MKTLITFLFVAALIPQIAFANEGPMTVGCETTGQTRDLEAMLKKMKTQWSVKGVASWYGPGFKNRPTSNGETFVFGKKTAAMKIYREKCVTVRNLRTNQQAVVWVNDNGPHVKGRIIDLSPASKAAIGANDTEQVEVLPTAQRNCASISPKARD